MKLIARTLFLVSLNVLVLGTIVKRNLISPNSLRYNCYDIRQYKIIERQLSICLIEKWKPLSIGSNGRLTLITERDCCFKYQEDFHFSKMIRRECDAVEPQMTEFDKKQSDLLSIDCLKVKITLSDDFCLKSEKNSLSDSCKQLLNDNTKAIVKTTPSPITTPTVTEAESRALRISYQIPVILLTFLSIFYIYIN